MIAVFVITVVRLLGPVPTASSASLRALLSATRLAAISVGEPRPLISVARPSLSPEPYQKRPFAAGEELGREAAQALLGAELEERVGLDAGLLGDVVLPGLDRLLHAVERAGDEVEVGARVVRQPGLREERVGRRDDRLRVLLEDVAGRARACRSRRASRSLPSCSSELAMLRAPRRRRASAASARCRGTRSARPSGT